MEKIEVYLQTPHKRATAKIIETLENDGIVLLPGDTSYLLAIKIGSKTALDKLNQLKQNKKKKFYSVMFRDFSDISHYTDISNQEFSFIRRYFPGPFTFIMKASKNIPKIMLQNRKEVGIRMPQMIFLQNLLAEYGKPILVSTANIDDSNEFFTDPEVDEPHWLRLVDLIADGGYLPHELTTIIHFEDSEYSIIRAGKGSI